MNLTAEQIESMPAGEEINRLVAEHFFHKSWQPAMALGGHDYSFELSDAWRITEKRPQEKKRRWYFTISQNTNDGGSWDLLVYDICWDTFHGLEDGIRFVDMKSLPLALSRAALLIALTEAKEKKN